MKASSQTAGWKRLLIQHGERAVLGIVGALVLWMLISVQADSLKPDKSPTNLDSRVSTGETYINTAQRLPPQSDKFNVKNYVDYNRQGARALAD